MEVKFTLGIGLSGCYQIEVVNLPDYYTDDMIEDEYQEWLASHIDGCWDKTAD